MCTASWILRDGGYELFFNRDEKRRRAHALPPRQDDAGGVAYLAPQDGDAGGTWIAVNELGLALCLLNRYPDPQRGSYVSRGHLVRGLAGAPAAEEIAARLAELERTEEPRFRPFVLLVLEPGTAPLRLTWDGRHVDRDTPSPPVSSSGYDPQGIGEVRRRQWRETLGTATPSSEELAAFHRSHRPERGPFSPCMHRDNARTVSFTHVRVTPAAVAHGSLTDVSRPVGSTGRSKTPACSVR